MSHRPKPAQASLRLFYALWPEPSVRAQLAQLLTGVQGRLVPAANLHITLAFLGQQPVSRVPALLEIAARASLPRMSLVLDHVGYFRRHGVLWVGMSQTPPALLEGRARLVEMLNEAGVPYDAGGRFKPHITLARDAAAPQSTTLAPITWEVPGKVELVSSTVVEQRVQYQLLDRSQAHWPDPSPNQLPGKSAP